MNALKEQIDLRFSDVMETLGAINSKLERLTAVSGTAEQTQRDVANIRIDLAALKSELAKLKD